MQKSLAGRMAASIVTKSYEERHSRACRDKKLCRNRFSAYSSIAHAVYMLIALLALIRQAIAGSF